MASTKDRLEAMERTVNNKWTLMAKEGRKAAKLEKKLKLLIGGYQSRGNALVKQLNELHDSLEQSSVELNTFTNLRDQELQAIPKRVETRKEEVTRLLERENSLQLRYSNLTLERDTMLSKLSEQP